MFGPGTNLALKLPLDHCLLKCSFLSPCGREIGQLETLRGRWAGHDSQILEALQSPAPRPALAGGDTRSAHLVDAEATARRAGVQPELALTLMQRGLLERMLRQGGLRPAPRASLNPGSPSSFHLHA